MESQHEKRISFRRSLAIMVKTLASMVLIAMCVTTGKEGFDFFFALTIILWLPLLLVSLIITLCNLRIRDTYQRAIVLWGVGNFLLLGFSWWLDNRLSNQVEADNLVAHYCEHERELWDLVDYTRAAMDSGAYLDIEFDGRKVERFLAHTANGEYKGGWSSQGPINAVEIGASIGLTADEIEGIRQRLKAAECISIALTNYGTDNGISIPMTTYGMVDSVAAYGNRRADCDIGIVEIGRMRYMLSAYYYNLYRHPMSDSTWNHLLLSDCTRIPVCDTMVLEYGSPAFGSECYPLKSEIVRRLNLKERKSGGR